MADLAELAGKRKLRLAIAGIELDGFLERGVGRLDVTGPAMVIGKRDQAAHRPGVRVFGDQLLDGGRGLGKTPHSGQRVGNFRIRHDARILFQSQTLNAQKLFEPVGLVSGGPGRVKGRDDRQDLKRRPASS